MCEFKGKTVFITGIAKGQGRGVALAFARQGANIAGIDLGCAIEYPKYNNSCSEDISKLKVELDNLGVESCLNCGDIRNEAEVKSAVDSTIAKFATIDILFNNAGICAYAKAQEMLEAEWDSMIDINLKGAWLTAKHIIPYMINAKSGVIINNSSIAGLRGMNRLSHYAASKWGMVGLTKSWAIELAPHNIRVLSIHPTGVGTPMNDGLAMLEGKSSEEIAEASAGNLINVPWIEVEDVAEAVLFLSSDKSRYMTGSQYVLDAGLLTR